MNELIIKPIKTRVFLEKQNLVDFIFFHIKKIKEKSILIVTSKIVALSEGRVGDIKDKIRLIKQESDWAIKTKHVWLTKKDGQIMANAGIDESNANDKLILLPKDSFKSAAWIRQAAIKKFKLKKLGVIITDSRTSPLRAGTTGMSLGYAGFVGIKNYQGKKDIYGRKFKFAKVNVADSLSAATVFAMGEGKELKPLAVIEGAEVVFKNRVSKKETKINLKDDIYFPILGKIKS